MGRKLIGKQAFGKIGTVCQYLPVRRFYETAKLFYQTKKNRQTNLQTRIVIVADLAGLPVDVQ